MDAFHTLRADEWWHVFHRKQWTQNSLWNWSTGRGWCANKNPSCRSHPLRCQTTYYKSVNNNQFVNREKLYLDHSSWMWNEYHPVPVCHIWNGGEPLANTRTPFEFHLSTQIRFICSVFSCEKELGWVNTALPQLNSRPYPIVQMWIVMMDGGMLPGIFKQYNLIWCVNPLLNPPFTVWTYQNNSSANTCRYDVATGSRTPDEGFFRIPNATCRQLFTMQQIWPLLWSAKLWCSDQ